MDILFRMNNFIWFVVDTVLLITNCFTITIKGVISDLIGVLYLFCFHCTYDDQVDRQKWCQKWDRHVNSGNKDNDNDETQ